MVVGISLGLVFALICGDFNIDQFVLNTSLIIGPIVVLDIITDRTKLDEHGNVFRYGTLINTLFLAGSSLIATGDWYQAFCLGCTAGAAMGLAVKCLNHHYKSAYSS